MCIYICNDHPFCVVVLEGYGVAGMYIVVLGYSDRMFGCLGNLVMCLPPDGGARPHHEVGSQFVSGAQASMMY